MLSVRGYAVTMMWARSLCFDNLTMVCFRCWYTVNIPGQEDIVVIIRTFRYILRYCYSVSLELPRWDTLDAEMKFLSAENSEPLKVLSLRPTVDQNIELYVSPTSEDSPCLISAFRVNSTSFPPSPRSYTVK